MNRVVIFWTLLAVAILLAGYHMVATIMPGMFTSSGYPYIGAVIAIWLVAGLLCWMAVAFNDEETKTWVRRGVLIVAILVSIGEIFSVAPQPVQKASAARQTLIGQLVTDFIMPTTANRTRGAIHAGFTRVADSLEALSARKEKQFTDDFLAGRMTESVYNDSMVAVQTLGARAERYRERARHDNPLGDGDGGVVYRYPDTATLVWVPVIDVASGDTLKIENGEAIHLINTYAHSQLPNMHGAGLLVRFDGLNEMTRAGWSDTAGTPHNTLATIHTGEPGVKYPALIQIPASGVGTLFFEGKVLR